MNDLTIESCFLRASHLEPGVERDAYLTEVGVRDPELGRHVQAMLALDGADSEILAETERVQAAPIGVGSRVGRYQLLELIGQGGSGDVYRAQSMHADLPEVALKVLRSGRGAGRILARFEGEYQALARMEHPGIAHIRDVGELPGARPYFAMELVAGRSLTNYADDERLSIVQRLELLWDLCQAVQHAHLKGVVHRDLKPSNVLVVEVDGVPVPKVIDFGLAKALSEVVADPGLTLEGSFLGTPQYMSPEQAGLRGEDIDTRADVYALGVLLYELLTGSTPLDEQELRGAGLLDVQRLVDGADFPRASVRVAGAAQRATIALQRGLRCEQLVKILERDLDWIAQRALARERDQRYQTVAELADDLGRYLDGETVSARPPSRLYRLEKFVARHLVATVAAALVSVALMLGGVGTAVGWLQARRAQADLVLAKAETDSVAQFQAQRMGAVDPREMGLFLRSWLLEQAVGEDEHRLMERRFSRADFTSLARDVTEHSILEPSLQAIDAEFSGRPAVQARLLRDLSEARTSLGLLDLALPPLERALELERKARGGQHARTQAIQLALASLRRKRGEYSVARELSEQVRQARNGTPLEEAQPLPIEAAVGTQVLDGAIAVGQARWEDAERQFASAETLAEEGVGQVHPSTIAALQNQGVLAQMRGEYAQAETIYTEALERLSSVGQTDSSEGYRILSNLCLVRAYQERWEGTDQLARRAHRGMSELHGTEHPLAQMTCEALVLVLRGQGKAGEALRVAQQALDALGASLGEEHERSILQAANVAKLQRELGDLESAQATGRQVAEAARNYLPQTSWLRAGILVDYGRTLAVLGRFPEAENEMMDGYELLQQLLPPNHLHVTEAENSLADLYDLWNEAEPDQGYAEAAAQWKQP